MANWVEPREGQIWRDIDRNILFIITEVKDSCSYPVKVLMDKTGGIFGEIRSSQYSMTYMKNLCEYQGESRVNLGALFSIID